MTKAILLPVLIAAVLPAACSLTGEASSTLYRSSILDAGARIHVASFDARDGDTYNRENCQTAADLFSKQPGVRVRYWCEKGPFRP